MAKIYNYFSDYINDDDLAYIGNAEITRFTVYKSDRRLELDITMDRLLDYPLVNRCQNALKNALELSSAKINIKYLKSLFNLSDIEKILRARELDLQETEIAYIFGVNRVQINRILNSGW